MYNFNVKKEQPTPPAKRAKSISNINFQCNDNEDFVVKSEPPNNSSSVFSIPIEPNEIIVVDESQPLFESLNGSEDIFLNVDMNDVSIKNIDDANNKKNLQLPAANRYKTLDGLVCAECEPVSN